MQPTTESDSASSMRTRALYVVDEEEPEVKGDYLWDDFSDEPDEGWEGIQKGRKEEIVNMKKFPVYELRPTWQCSDFDWSDVRWVGSQRGDGSWRCRLVRRQFKGLDPFRYGLYTPASCERSGRLLDLKASKKKYSRIVGDATNAYFHAVENDKVCCTPPAEILMGLSLLIDGVHIHLNLLAKKFHQLLGCCHCFQAKISAISKPTAPRYHPTIYKHRGKQG